MRKIALIIVCLGALAPLSVFYHELRDYRHAVESLESRLATEFRSFRPYLNRPRVSLVNSPSHSPLQNTRRKFLAQYALAPVLVTFRSRPLSLVHVQNEIPEARGRLIATGSEYLLYKK